MMLMKGRKEKSAFFFFSRGLPRRDLMGESCGISQRKWARKVGSEQRRTIFILSWFLKSDPRSFVPFEGAADGNGRSDLQKLHYASVRPKGLTAERFGQIFGEFSAETALLAGFGHSAVT